MKEMNDEFWKRYEGEIESFLFLCCKEDRLFLDIPKKKRKTEDYVRLICINVIFGFNGVIIKIAGEAGNRFDEVLEYFNKIKGDITIIDGWMNDFIEKISEPEAQKLVSEFWNERRKKVSKEDFNVGQFLLKA